MGFPRQEYGKGCHFPLQGVVPTQGLSTCLLRWQAGSLPLSTREAQLMYLFTPMLTAAPGTGEGLVLAQKP